MWDTDGKRARPARFVSVWFNTVLVAAVYTFTRRYADHRTRVVAALLTLPLPAGTPPLSYTVAIDVYTVDSTEQIRYLDLLDRAGNPAGQSFRTRPICLAHALGLCLNPYRAAPDLPALAERFSVDGLVLEAAAFERETAAPGQAIYLTLRWRAQTAPLPDLRPALELRQDDRTVASVSAAPAAGHLVAQHDGQAVHTRPTTGWLPGEIVLDQRTLTIHQVIAEGGYLMQAGMNALDDGRLTTADGLDAVRLKTVIVNSEP